MYPAWYFTTALGILLQGSLLWRASACSLWRRYPLFYVYLAFTTIWSVICTLPLIINNPQYSKIYWLTYLVAAVLRFGIGAEIHRSMFPRGSGIRKRANIVVVLALVIVAAAFWTSTPHPAASLLLDSLRKVALSVAVWIVLVFGLAHFYRVRVSRNIFGMAAGLLIFTGSELVYLAAMDLLPRLRTVWSYVHPLAFLAMLLVWTYSLWGYFPNPRSSDLDETTAQSALHIWQNRWEDVPEVLRRVVKS